MSQNYRSGFSVIEVLVVVSIISILAVISSSVFSNAPKNNRDGKRERDLQAMKQALELYRTNNYSYPQTPAGLDNQNALFFKDTTSLTPTPGLNMNEVPTDPSVDQIYRYKAFPDSCTTSNKDCTSFVVCARKEGNGTYDVFPACTSLNCKTWTNSCDADSCCNIGLASD